MEILNEIEFWVYIFACIGFVWVLTSIPKGVIYVIELFQNK